MGHDDKLTTESRPKGLQQ